jgi:hypothetical protein
MIDLNLDVFYVETLKFLKDNIIGNNYKLNSGKISKFKKEVADLLEQHWSLNISELYYCILKNIQEQPKCYCEKEVKFNDFSKGYNNTCSIFCSVNNPLRKEKAKQTNLERYGAENPFSSKIIKEKIKKTNLKKYGVDNPNQNKDIRDKSKNTNLERYGVENANQNKEIQAKKKKTNLERYGVENVGQNEEIKKKIQKTNLEKYGNICSLHGKEVEKKVKKSFIKKYGVDNPFSSKKIKEQIQKTNLEKYGVEYPSQNKEIKEQIQKTNIERYGVENVGQNEEIKKKIQKTNLEKYGVESNFQIHIKNIKNLNTEYINKNFSNDKGFLDRKDVLNYFNISKVYFIPSHRKFRSQNFEDLLPFENKLNKTQNDIYNYFYKNNLNKNNDKNYHLLNIKINDRKTLSYKDNNGKKFSLELDILDEENKIAIEYNGLMYHSFGINKHSIFNNFEKEYIDKNKHLIKTQLCEEKEIELFHIFENEWIDNQKQLIWKSIINGKLGKHNRIFARKTIIKEIKNNNLIKDFLNKNHMQGYINSSINIGLFIINENINNDTGLLETKEKLQDMNIDKYELISLMTFGKPRMSKEYEYELLRYASKLNATIVGGGSKLLSYFEKNYNPESLISYANRRWSTGNFYKKTGFSFSHYSNPNYFYFKPDLINKNKKENENENILYSRNQFQKHKLEKYFNEGKLSYFEINLTETQNMYNNGYRKIYDSGNIIFYKKYNI